MADQADIHRKAISSRFTERKEAVDQFRNNFTILPDKEQVWYDLHNLTMDKYRDVRQGAAYALGTAFPHAPDKKQAWNDLHRLTLDADCNVRQGAASALGTAFLHIPDKEQAWGDLIRLAHDEYGDVRWRVTGALGTAFPHAPDKKQAWNDLHRLTLDADCNVRQGAASALGTAFLHIPDKEQAWGDLILLAHDEYGDVRWWAADALGTAFLHIPDKEQAWGDLIRLAYDEYGDVRWRVTGALGAAFPHAPAKKQAWKDLRRLILDADCNVRWGAAHVLGTAFSHVPDKKQAWNDLRRLTLDADWNVRWWAADALGTAFLHIPDKEQAWGDLIWMTHDEYGEIRRVAVHKLGTAFPHIPDKEQAWGDLIRLTHDEYSDVRIYANHSLGRISIFKATEAEGEESFKKELENALNFFEESLSEDISEESLSEDISEESLSEDIFEESLSEDISEKSLSEETYPNPSRFCLSFYRSFYTLTFEKDKAKNEIQRYLDEAKNASEDSENKETLIEAIENLANALTEVYNTQEMGLGTKQSDLNAFMRYCDRAADLIGTAGKNTPWAAKVIKRGLPIINQRIKDAIAEIQEKTEALCRQTKDTSFEELGKEIHQIGQSFLQIRDPIELEKGFDILQFALSDICDKLPGKVRRGACEMLEIANEKSHIEDKIVWISMFLSKIPHYIGEGKEMTRIEIKNSNIGQIGDGTVNMNLLANQKEKSDQNPEKRTETNTIPFISDLESEICDIFKSVYQKEREECTSEVDSKTLEFLKHKLLDLTASGKRIDWLDVGCGNGRCLDVIDAVWNRDIIRYHGTDSSYRYLDDTEERARKYGLDARLDKMDAAAMKFDSEYDVVSAVLLLHEVDPLCLPYILRNMLRALKGDGTLIIADFQGPYEQEDGVVAWGAEDIKSLLESIGGAKMSIEFIPSSQYPDELGFYRCYVKKPELDREKFSNLSQGYDNFLDAKKEESKQKRGELRSQIEERVRKLLNRPDIDLKNISHEEMSRIQTEMGDEYGIKAHKIRLLTSQIEFLDDKIKEFGSGVGCAGADQHAP